jgi:type I restriction enzyme S subunit
MTKSWPQVALGDLAAAEDAAIAIGPFGSRMKAHNYTQSGVPVVRGQNLTDSGGIAGDFVFVSEEFATGLGSSNLKEADIVLPHRGAIGRVALVPPGRFLMSTSLMRIRLDRSKVLPKFALYCLLSSDGRAEILKFASTVGTPGIGQPLTSLKQMRIPLPDMAEQRRIAGVLGALDDLIETNQRLMTSLQGAISAQYRRLMLADTRSVPLFDAFEVDFGAAFKGSEFTSPGEGLPLLRIRDLKTFTSAVWTRERIKGDVLVSPGDVVVGMDAEFRSTLWLGAPSLLNQRVCRVRPRIGSTSFVREALVEPLAFIEGHKTGTTVSHLNKGDLEETKILLPSEDALAIFDAAAEPMRLAVIALYQEAEALRRTRDELLPLLLSGRVSVREVAA